MQFISTEEALREVGDRLVDDVRASQSKKGLRASGRSAKSARAVITTNQTKKRLRIIGAAHWRFQQNGRGPGRYKYPSKKMVLAIEEWLADKGLNIPAYAVAFKINRDGIKVPNQFNPGGVLSEPLELKRVRGLLKVALRPQYIKSAKSILFS